MKYARYLCMCALVLFYWQTRPTLVHADTGYCETDCGTGRTCDYQCMDGGSFTTCGDYNGGAGNGMCTGSQPYCGYTLVFFTAERQVTEMNVECSWPHTPPWSNFGVESPYGSRQDSDQFEGWYIPTGDNETQWNACTGIWTPPDASFYNANNYTTQESNPARHYVYTAWSEAGSCVDQMEDEVFAIGSTWAEVWDLDSNWPDEYLSTLYFPATNVVISSCNSQDDSCSGESALEDPTSGPSYFTARYKAGLYGTGYLGQ